MENRTALRQYPEPPAHWRLYEDGPDRDLYEALDAWHREWVRRDSWHRHQRGVFPDSRCWHQSLVDDDRYSHAERAAKGLEAMRSKRVVPQHIDMNAIYRHGGHR